ncbi:MAG: ribbon-helix-helix domain-containing protein [Pseudomonadota bacterium]
MVGFSCQLNDDFHRKLKMLAVEEKTSMVNLVVKAVEQLFEQKNGAKDTRKRGKSAC